MPTLRGQQTFWASEFFRHISTYCIIPLCLLTTASHAAENTFPLEIQFSFDTQAIDGKQVSGYRLYMEGDLVCETEQVESEEQSIQCSVSHEPGTYNFTLSVLYSDNSESPQSPPFPFSLVLNGDINGDNILDLKDTVLGLQVAMGLNPDGVKTAGALDKDGKIGLKEVIYSLNNL